MVILSHIIKDGLLIPYEEWSDYIDTLKQATKETIIDERKAVIKLQKLFVNAVKKRIPKEKFGIFFSGGVDSTLIAYTIKQFTSNFICYTVGIKGSSDLEFSESVAKELKFNHVKNVLSMEEIESLFERVTRILPKETYNVVNLGVGSVVLAAIELAEKERIKTFFGGLGSEEIFAGYKRHEDAKNINEECWSGLKTTWQRDFQRDDAIAIHKNANFLIPFLDKDLILMAMAIDGKLKIKQGHKKYILRKMALEMGLKKEFAFRPKKAAQYGSSFDKAIMKLAKKYGFKYKKEYLDYLCKHK